MTTIEFSKREMLKMVLYSIWLTMRDAGAWAWRNGPNLFIQVVAYCLITLGFAAFIWGAFGGMQ